jgi:NAD+ diphosphatase
LKNDFTLDHCSTGHRSTRRLGRGAQPEGFLFDDNGALFPREWLKRQDLAILAEHGIGHLDGEPVYLLELRSHSEVPGCQWKGLRAFMLEGDHTVYKVLAYAAQIGTWAREHAIAAIAGRP